VLCSVVSVLVFVFFFSSRRRHTRWPRDWSSDVCSSDLGLAGQAEELLVAGGLALSDRGEVLVFITEEKDLPEISFRLGFDLRNAAEDGALEIELHHHAEGSCKTGVHARGKIQGAYRPLLNEPAE